MMLVVRVSLVMELVRVGEFCEVFDFYVVCLHEYVWYGNFVYVVIMLRNLVVVFVVVGDDRGATVLVVVILGD